MKTLMLIVGLCLLTLVPGCATSEPVAQAGSTTISTPTVVVASCGTCKLGMKGNSCDLAVRIDGKSYFVDGFKLEQFGDPHAPNGMCNAELKATVTGKVANGRFVASTFELQPKK